jgi:serine phosphatase RsbU (regulator of sigma subunit)
MKRLTLHIIVAIMALISWTPRLSFAQTQNSHLADSLINIVRNLPDTKPKLSILFEICKNHANVDTIHAYAEQMQDLATKLGNAKMLGRAYKFLGWSYNSRGNYEKAMANHYRALIIYDSIADTLNLAWCYNKTGEDLLRLKSYYSADKYLHKALEIYSQLGLKSEFPTIYRNLGAMYRDYKVFETAKQYFGNAIEIDSMLNNTNGLIIDYNYLAMTEYIEYNELYDEECIKSAMRNNNIAYHKAVELNDTSNLILVMQSALPICLDYADILDSTSRQHLLDSCVQIYHQAVVLSKALGYTNNFSILENGRSRHLLLNRRYTDCINHLEATRKKAEANSDIPFEMDYDCYIECYAAMGNHKKALEYLKLKSKAENQAYFFGQTMNSSKSSTKEMFEQKLRDQERDKKNRELLFEEHKKMIRIINISTTIFIVILIVFAIFAFIELRNKQRNNKTLMAQKDEYATQRNILTNINIQITDSIRYAKEIQNAIIPSAPIMNSIFGENLVIWIPIDIISGNFYWAKQTGHYKMLAVADCLRHGVPGAFTSMLGITSLNDIVATEISENHCPTASSILDKLRTKIESTIPQQEQSEPANVIDIALCIIDTESNTLQFAGAHSPMLIIRNGKLTMIESDNIHIGVSDGANDEFTNTKVALHAGDVVYLYTDGIASQLNSKWNDSAGILSELLTTIHYLPFAEQTEYINYALSKSPKSQEIIDQTDDILMVGIRIGKATEEC